MGGVARTHLAIEPRLSGGIVELGDRRARVRLQTVPEMVADEDGLVHGGFVFSLADYCAMLAVNEPNVVLASARMEFLAPVAVGEAIEAAAEIVSTTGRAHEVEVVVERVGDRAGVVARGEMSCLVTARHVLAPRDRAAEP